MTDHRTRSMNIPVTALGFAVTREVMADPARPGCLLLVVTKTGEAGTAHGIATGAGAGHAEARVPIPCDKPPEEDKGNDCGSPSLPDTEVTWLTGPLGQGRWVKASPLTRCEGNTKGTAGDSDVYPDQFKCIKDAKLSRVWYPAHLLHGKTYLSPVENMHGPGDERWNIIIADVSVNKRMSLLMERPVLNLLYKHNQVLWYEVTVKQYFPGAELFAKAISVEYGMYDPVTRTEGPPIGGASFISDRTPPDCPTTLPPTTPPKTIPPPKLPPVTKPPAAERLADFESTISICQQVLTTRVFPVKNGGLAVTLDPDWSRAEPDQPAASCTGTTSYWVSLVRKSTPFDTELSTVTLLTGRRAHLIWEGLENGDYQLLIFAGDHDPACCLTGDISVTTFETSQ